MLPFTVEDERWFKDELARLDTPEGRREVLEDEMSAPVMHLDPDLSAMRAISDNALWRRQAERNAEKRIAALKLSLLTELAKVPR